MAGGLIVRHATSRRGGAVRLTVAVVVLVGRESIKRYSDLVFVALVIVGGPCFTVFLTCSSVWGSSVWWRRPRAVPRRLPTMNQIPQLIRVFAFLSLLTFGGDMAFPNSRLLPSRIIIGSRSGNSSTLQHWPGGTWS